MKTSALWIVLWMLGGCWSYAAEYVFDLPWRADGISENFRVDNRTSEQFSKEPDLEGRKIYRGKVWLDDKEPAGFVWDKKESRLYIDLNRDGDLTNDPNGVLTENKRQDYNHEFGPFTITRQTVFGTISYVIDVRISSYNESYFYANFSLRSGFRGQLLLNEKKWEFSVADIPGKSETNRFKCRLDQPKKNDYRTWWNAGERIFFDGQNYALKLQWAKKDDVPLLQAVFTEMPTAMGQLEIMGKGIKALSLRSNNSIVFPEIIDKPVPVPAGQYHCLEFRLTGKDKYRDVIPQTIDKLICDVPENGVGQLKAGAPLDHTVDMERMGSTLKFNYKLVGIGGEPYDVQQVTGYANDKKPKVEIYKGDMLLASGQFEFG